jgi:hypothetical protein
MRIAVEPGTVTHDELSDQLTQLGRLHAAAVLTAEEFAAAKKRLLDL